MTEGDRFDVDTDQDFAATSTGTPVAVYQRCKRAARAQTVVTYEDVNQDCGLGLDFADPSHRNRISEMLGEVSSFEVRNGRPIITAVVVLKGSKPRLPGPGFFDWNGDRKFRGHAGEDNQRYFARTLKEVFEFWGHR